MLIQFSTRNFKSFKETFTLDLFTNKTNAVCSIYEEGNLKIYPSSVFYGANASGKSNIINAFFMMRRLVLNTDKIIQSTDILPTNKFKLSSDSEDDTTAFDITFTFNKKKYKYGFEYDSTCVYAEYLYVYDSVHPTIVFEYDVDEDNEKIKITKYKDLQKINHLKNSLFLVEADRNGNEEAKNVLKWFKTSNVIEFSSAKILSPEYWNNLENPELKKIFQDFINNADFGIKDIFQDSKKVSTDFSHIPNIPKNAIVEELTVKNSSF